MKLLILLLLSCLLIACSSDKNNDETGLSPVKNSKSNKTGPILILGDSLAYGKGAPLDSKKLGPLHNCIEDNFNHTTLNFGVNGATSSDTLNTINKTLSATPAIVILSTGGNDVLHDTYVRSFPESLSFSNIRSIYKKLTSQGIMVVHMGIAPPDPTAARLPKFETIAQDEGVLFVAQTMKDLWNNNELMSDRIHPNKKGYEIICDRLAQAIRPHY